MPRPLVGRRERRPPDPSPHLRRTPPDPTGIPTWYAKRARSAIGASWRDWANLSDGPAGLIAERLLASDVADYVSFRAACRPWRLCSTDPREHGVLDRRFHPNQWTMLRTEGGSRCRRGFMNVATGCCRYVRLPELRGHNVFGLTTEGLVLLLHRATRAVRLLNPFTRQAAGLPPATTLLSESNLERRRDWEDSVEISGAGLACDVIVAVCLAGISMVAVAKPGDAHWNRIVVDRDIVQAMSFAGRFYGATTRAVMVVETSDDQPPQLAVVSDLARPFSGMMMDTVHLMDNDSGGELALVDRKCNGSRMLRKYEVYKVDLDARKLVPVHGLGGRPMFIGWEHALSISPSAFPSIRADTIYLGFDSLLAGWMDGSPVYLMNGTSERRRFNGDMPIYGPRGVDHCLSRCNVTSYRDGYGLMDRC